MPSTNRPLGDAQCRNPWGEPKRCRSLSLSDTGWDILTRLAAVNSCNRSEALERLLRQAAKLTAPEPA